MVEKAVVEETVVEETVVEETVVESGTASTLSNKCRVSTRAKLVCICVNVCVRPYQLHGVFAAVLKRRTPVCWAREASFKHRYHRKVAIRKVRIYKNSQIVAKADAGKLKLAKAFARRG